MFRTIIKTINYIIKSILKVYIIAIILLIIIGLIAAALGFESVFGIDIARLAGKMIGLLLLPFIYLSLAKSFLGIDDTPKSNNRKEYLDVGSAIRFGMSSKDIVKYNTGDLDTREKYKNIAHHINKTDKNYMG